MTEEAAALALGIVGEGDAAELAAEDVRDTVVFGEAFIEEGVVGAQELGDRAIGANDVLEENFGLAAHRLTEVFIEVDEPARIGRDGGEAAEMEPLRGEIIDEIF